MPYSFKSKAFYYQRLLKKPFNIQKTEVKNVVLYSTEETVPLTVETDASNYTTTATLNQSGRPAAYFPHQQKHSSIRKVHAIVEALRFITTNNFQ